LPIFFNSIQFNSILSITILYCNFSIAGGGQHVNPAVTVSMWALNKCSYTEGFVRIAGQMGGGLVAFPLFHFVSEQLGLTPFGGPEFSQDNDAEAFVSEFVASFLLMWVIYIVSTKPARQQLEKYCLCQPGLRNNLFTSCSLSIILNALICKFFRWFDSTFLTTPRTQLNWEFNFGKYHYIIKQFLTAVAIRALIEFFPTAGPAMNPMLATAWYVFGVGTNGEFPDDTTHYFVYWFGPFVAGVLAAITYIVWDGNDKLFGTYSVPIGPLRPKKVKGKKAMKSKKE
jgi:glycerol uptake facilitator-like aquaporin